MSRKAAYQRERRARLRAAAGNSDSRESRLLSRMTPADRYYLEDAEKYVASQDRQIPGYIKYGMTEDQIRAEVIKHVQEEGGMGVNGSSVDRLDIDARFPKPQDSRYDKLVRAMNGIDLSKVRHSDYEEGGRYGVRNSSWDWQYFKQTAERMTSGYSTKELGEFVRNELKERVYTKGGRPRYMDAITIELHRRFISQGDGLVKRSRLSDPTSKLDSFVRSVHSALSVRETYRERAQAIRAKYQRTRK